MSDWQPIETAPKDGTWVIMACTWNKYTRGAVQFVDGVWLDWRDCQFDITTASHWQLFPAPPEAGR